MRVLGSNVPEIINFSFMSCFFFFFWGGGGGGVGWGGGFGLLFFYRSSKLKGSTSAGVSLL